MTTIRGMLGTALLLAAAGAAWGEAPGSDAERCTGVTNNPDLAIQHCTRAIESGQISGRDLAVLYFSRAYEQAAKGDHDRAIADYSAAIKHDPGFADAYFNRGHALGNKGDHERAIADYGAALKLNPRDPAPHVARAVEWAITGDYRSALSDYDAALRLDSRSVDALFGRGRALFYSGDLKRAIADMETAMKANPNEYTALWLYLVRRRAGLEADEQLQLAARPGGWPAQVLTFYLGRTDVKSVMAGATDVDPRRARDQGCEARFYLAHWHLLLNERPRAIELLKEVEKGCPRNSLEYEGAAAELRRLQAR
jgi:tetratricopeptide (TPR) repeat protein